MNSPRVLIPLADGFEEIEGITIIDILRRANIDVITAGLKEGPVEASRKTRHLPDTTLEKVFHQTFDAVILPGGQEGAQHLKEDPRIHEILLRHTRAGKWVAAICAAPIVLHEVGLLSGKRATSHPSVRKQIPEIHAVKERVVVDGNIVTSLSAGSAMEFAFKLVELLRGPETAEEVNQGVLAKW